MTLTADQRELVRKALHLALMTATEAEMAGQPLDGKLVEGWRDLLTQVRKEGA